MFGLVSSAYQQIPRQDGHERHHIIPKSMKHKVLDDIGFDVDQNRNIIQLPKYGSVDPTKTVHRGKHKADYDKMITGRLDEIDKLNASNDIKKMHVDALMDEIGDDLRNKRITLNNAQ